MPETQTKVLVVEDDETMREVVVHKLTISNFIVLEAADGAQAVEIWKKEKPDIVLLDLMLPKMDGFKVLETIRGQSNPDVAGTSVIILSNLFDKEDIEKAKALSIDDYMVKAYNTTEEIMNRISETLKRKKEK